MILTENLFPWREAYWANFVTWHGGTQASPSHVRDNPMVADAPMIGASENTALQVQRGHRLRVSITYTLPEGEVESGINVQFQRTKPTSVYYQVLRTAFEPAAEDNIVIQDFVWHGDEGLFRPIIRLYGSTNLRIKSIQVRRVDEDDFGLRSWDSGDATGSVLNAISKEGDLAVLAMASQYGNTQARPPEGWTAVVTDGGSARSGYVAFKRVTSPLDTLSIAPIAGDSSAARKRALLLVYKGDAPGLSADREPVAHGWQEAPFTLPSGARQILLSQRHAVAGADAGRWVPQGGRAKEAGGPSASAAWSMLRGALTSTAPAALPQGTEPQMWARILLPGEKPNTGTFILREGEEKPAKVRRFPSGRVRTVEDLLKSRGFWIAHRGGSASWPEGTMRAYTESAARGAYALEVSAHRTKDGVWFANHDLTLNRVTGGASNTDVREMTWEEVSRFKVRGLPFGLWDEIKEAYADDFVLFVDPKNSAIEWRDMVKGLDKSRTVLKFSADATWLAKQWKDDGWTTWGYGYESQLATGQLKSWIDAGVWDIVGMEFYASQETWDAVKGWGLPTIGHIAEGKSHYDTALARGADGVMLAGVADLAPDPLV